MALTFSLNVFALNGHLLSEISQTDKNWDFVPEVTNSFNFSESSKSELFLLDNNLGFRFSETNFNLDLIRSTHPKNINFNTNSQFIEFLYVFNDRNAFSFSFKEQIADTQLIDCYTFSNLTIGFCEDALINIRNSKDKYTPLGDSSIMMIDASNKELQIKLYRATNFGFSNYIDEIQFYMGVSENKFNWLSPIEEMTTGFFSNILYNGSSIGNLVSKEIRRLPQRDKWLFYKLGINLKKDFEVLPKVNIFYDFDLVLVETEDYVSLNSINSFNSKVETGLSYSPTKNLIFSLSGTFYKNNLFGYQDLSFSQRTEHHFKKSFASINSSIKFIF